MDSASMAHYTSLWIERKSLLLLLLPLLLLPVQVLSQDSFDLTDALDGEDDGKLDSDSLDLFKDGIITTTSKAPPKVAPKSPASTKAPVKPKLGDDDLNLADALDPSNDISVKNKNKEQGGTFSDSDLFDVSKDETYKPDKGKGGRSREASNVINQHDDDNGETRTEVGTIAGIASAVAMALVGAVSSYISYQKKKLCFSLQQSLNTDMVKTENPEAVMATEPQAQHTLLERPIDDPPIEENAV